jgi:sigma-B regulation protein RsbU (phosphoserine phosphatase)
LDKLARVRAELDAAHQIQLRFTPNDVPPIPHVLLKGVYYPANEVGGDYLDYFQTDDGNWVIAIADVCGKGIPAALFMIMLRSAYRLVGRNAQSAKELLCEVNTAMKHSINERAFITTLCCVISKDGGSMTYARAGHPKLIRIPGSSEAAYEIATNGLALGLSEDDRVFTEILNEVTVPLVKGDRFLMFTDGLPESNDPGKNEYGIKRLLGLVSKNKDKKPETLITTIMTDLNNFTNNGPAHDDLTMLAMEIT